MKKRIGIVTPGADQRAGGVERFSNLLADVLADDYDVSIVPSTRAEGVQFAPAGWYRDSVATAAQLNATESFDLLITGVTTGGGFDPGVPRIHVCHGTMAKNALAAIGEPLKARLSAGLGGGWAERRAAKNATLVAVSHSTAREMSRYVQSRHPIHVIENGVDVEKFHPTSRTDGRTRFGWSPTEPVALFVGRPERRKGIDIAVEACAQAGYRLVIAGSRPYEGAEWLGLLDPVELRDAYSAVDCVIFPTRYEACSYAILEAISCGAPLLTTAVGWMSDIAAQHPVVDDGLLEPKVEPFATALARLRAQPAGYAAMTRCLQTVVARDNSIKAFGDSWRALVREVMEGSS